MRLGRHELADLRAALKGAVKAGGSAARAAKRVLVRLEPRPAPVPAGQTALWHPDTGKPWMRLPLEARVVCPPFTPPGASRPTEIPVRCCLARLAATWPGRNRMKDGTTRPKQAGVYEKCTTCTLGLFYLDAVRRAVPGYALPKYKTYRPNSHEQHVKRRKHYLSTPNWRSLDEDGSTATPELDEEDLRELVDRKGR